MLSTPSMIALMERASILAYFARRHTTVGFKVHFKYFGATQRQVTERTELIEVRKLRFKVEAHDEHKKVGDSTHRRAIITIQR